MVFEEDDINDLERQAMEEGCGFSFTLEHRATSMIEDKSQNELDILSEEAQLCPL